MTFGQYSIPRLELSNLRIYMLLCIASHILYIDIAALYDDSIGLHLMEG